MSDTGVNIILSLAIVVLIVMSSFFSSSETAYSSVNTIRMKSLADDNVKGARKAVYICENYKKTLATILVGNNLVNIACTTICAFLFGRAIVNPTVANIVNTVVMTIIILIFGEILPKSLAKHNSEKTALAFAGIMYFLVKVMTPITWFFIKLQNAIVRDKENPEPTVTEDELEDIINTMEDEGVIDSEDADLIQGVLDLNERCAYDIMTPRVDVTAISIDEDVDKIKNIFIDTQYSRLPVYTDSIDNVVGVLSQKDFFAAILLKHKISVKNLMSEPLFMSEKLKVDDIIRQMQATKKHLAIVIDEYGGTSGIVTMENAIEEIVGDIYDEHDEIEVNDSIKKVSDDTFVVGGEVEIEELFEHLGIEHMPESDYSDVAGLIYERCEDLPVENEEIKMEISDDVLQEDGEYETKEVELTFKILGVEDNRVTKVQVVITPKSQEEHE
ncbi:MAG: HlyC/CorC family transporter [Clostridia bacterium]|nr:HlyC/CorC family transporter [Clostridia bacterium]